MASGPGHHTTQRYHLAQFTGGNPKGHVWVYNKSSGLVRSDAPENISVENYFYSIEKPDGTWDNRPDDWITGVEGKAKPVYDALLEESIPPYSQDKYDFALYLAVSYVRTRSRRRIATEAYGHVFQSQMFAMASNDRWFNREIANYEKKHGKPLSEEAKNNLREIALQPADKVTMSVSKNVSFEAWTVVDALTPILLDMEWTIIKPQRGYFITGDNPLLRRASSRLAGRGDRGFLDKSVEVTFPLSPQKMLLLEHKSRSRPIFTIPRDIVDGINHSRAAQCERELYAHIRDKRIRKIAHQYKGVRPRIILSGLGPKKYAEVVSPRRFVS